MPFNKLKKYPELLDLNSLDERSRKASLKGIFDRDITENDNFCFRGKRIYPIKTDGEIDMDRELLHLTTEEIEEADEQRYISTEYTIGIALNGFTGSDPMWRKRLRIVISLCLASMSVTSGNVQM